MPLVWRHSRLRLSPDPEVPGIVSVNAAGLAAFKNDAPIVDLNIAISFSKCRWSGGIQVRYRWNYVRCLKLVSVNAAGLAAFKIVKNFSRVYGKSFSKCRWSGGIQERKSKV